MVYTPLSYLNCFFGSSQVSHHPRHQEDDGFGCGPKMPGGRPCNIQWALLSLRMFFASNGYGKSEKRCLKTTRLRYLLYEFEGIWRFNSLSLLQYLYQPRILKASSLSSPPQKKNTDAPRVPRNKLMEQAALRKMSQMPAVQQVEVEGGRPLKIILWCFRKGAM